MGFWRGFIIASALSTVSAAATAQSLGVTPAGQGGTAAQPQPRYHAPDPARAAEAEAALRAYDNPTLTRFASEEDFRRYLGLVLAAARARGGWYGAGEHIQFAQAQTGTQSDTVDPICPESDPACGMAESDEGQIVVTGSRIAAPSNASVSGVTAIGTSNITNGEITNNQMRGVEEGDIVKQINEFLLVLQDGRVFVVDTRAGHGRRLALADRANVYRDPDADMWYDEMLVFGDRVLITGYSYEQDATELTVLRLDTATGRLSREGVFYLSSDDYYDTSNYATRLIGDNLVIYTPFQVSQMARQTFRWPMVRRWLSDDEREIDADRRSRPLFNAAEIYRPVRETEDPTVHTVSVCPLGAAGGERNLECRTTAFVGPNQAEWYVTTTDAYLWTSSRDRQHFDDQACDTRPGFSAVADPALLYQVPVDGSGPGVLGTRGLPPDQFSLHASGGRFHALLKNRPMDCGDEQEDEARLAYLDVPLARFSATLGEVEGERYTPLPGVKSHYIANRFTDSYLVYGSLGRYRRGLSENAMPPAYAVPLDRPQDVRALPVRHTVLRAEQAGNDIVLTGYRDQRGLRVTLIDLDHRPRIASSVFLGGRFESEGRSHAFNSLIERGGDGVMGLPTIRREGNSTRAAWRSNASDLSFLTVDRRGQLLPIGELERRVSYADEYGDETIPGYECEVSCIDWYGNSRPIFTDGRIFALTGTELIEGRINDDVILEVQRLNIAVPRTRIAQNTTP